MTATTQIRLVVITASPNDAERIESHLRNAGHALHTDWMADAEQLGKHLPQADLVLCNDTLANARLKDVIAQCNQAGRPVPLLALSEVVDVARATQVMRAGARDLVSLQFLEHLQFVILRELEAARLRNHLQEAHSRLQQMESRHDSLLQDASEALAYIQEGIHIRANPAYARLFGFSDAKSVEGLPLMDLIAIDERPRLKQHLRQVSRGQPDKELQPFKGLNIDGSNFTVGVRFTPTQIDDEDCLEVLAIPEAQPAAAAATPEAAAGFTGGHGRQALYTALDQALQEGDKQSGMLSAMFVRVDGLDRMEQRLGFNQADHVCNELAAFLLQFCSAGDQAFRFSSGEFVVLANRPGPKQLEQAANELRSAVANQVFGEKDKATALTVSVAVLPLAWHTETQQILREARQQVTSLQDRQGSGVFLEAPREKAATPQQHEKLWLARIKTALEENRFRLVYKSIVNLEGEASHYFDALIRMLDEKGEELPAQDFLPIAKRHGLMILIDQWVVQQSLLTLATRQKTNQDFGLFVRVSDSAIGAMDKFLPWLLKQIKGYPIKTEGLLLTFTETGLLDHQAKSKQLLSDLHKLKIRTAVSHFGVSPQAVQLLDQVPVDFVRLDAGVIKALSNPKTSERVGETLRHARQKGIRIVAKHVTDAQTMAMLWTLGVHFIEGDYTSEIDVFMQQAQMA